MATCPEDGGIKLRSYQHEMLDASMKGNIIVAMDTGSGKTHVAIARIRKELEASTVSKVGRSFLCVPEKIRSLGISF